MGIVFQKEDRENASYQMQKLAKEKLNEGRNQVLYLLLAIGDENVAHDHWHPDRAEFLFEVRRAIVHRLKHRIVWPQEWPDFEHYTYSPG